MTRKRHIAIVDDEANIGRSLRLILEGEAAFTPLIGVCVIRAATVHPGRHLTVD